jgi:hypothetical protein
MFDPKSVTQMTPEVVQAIRAAAPAQLKAINATPRLSSAIMETLDALEEFLVLRKEGKLADA